MKLIFYLFLAANLFSRSYVYTGHYPVLPQPYYFAAGVEMDLSKDGNIYSK
jgi:hypothetical protein